MPLSTDARVLIVGAGTFGLSTALHLLRRGHTSVTLLDPYPPPSPISAGNDINKILITSSASPFLSRLSADTLAAWRSDPVFSPYLHETGIVICGNSPDVLDEIRERAEDYGRSHGGDVPKELIGGADFADVIPALTAEMQGWHGYLLAKDNGWLEARNACVGAADECRRLGAVFVEGRAAALIFDGSGACRGARTTEGLEILADRTVLSAGASSVEVLDFKNQLLAKCWTLAHIKVTQEEGKGLKDQPMLLNFEKGFFFEPDANGEVKVCNEFPGYTNYGEDGLSRPLRREQIPLEAEQGVRELLAETVPAWKNKEFAWARICWCVDTPDRKFILCEHPEHENLVLATGDSGLAFKFLPIIGRWISDVVENGDSGLPEEERYNWRWRPETGDDWDDTGDRWGGDGKIKDLKDAGGWTNIPSSK